MGAIRLPISFCHFILGVVALRFERDDDDGRWRGVFACMRRRSGFAEVIQPLWLLACGAGSAAVPGLRGESCGRENQSKILRRSLSLHHQKNWNRSGTY